MDFLFFNNFSFNTVLNFLFFKTISTNNDTFAISNFLYLIFGIYLIFRLWTSRRELFHSSQTPLGFGSNLGRTITEAIKDPIDSTISLNAGLLHTLLESFEEGKGIKHSLKIHLFSLIGWTLTVFVTYFIAVIIFTFLKGY